MSKLIMYNHLTDQEFDELGSERINDYTENTNGEYPVITEEESRELYEIKKNNRKISKIRNKVKKKNIDLLNKKIEI